MAQYWTNRFGLTQEYNPDANYIFEDAEGNQFVSKGDNGYVWQAVTENKPISVTSSGQWYTEPFVEFEGNNMVAHIPDWFKDTPEYTEWKTIADQYPETGWGAEQQTQAKEILSDLGSLGSFRTSINNNLAQSFGITDQTIQNQVADNLIGIASEGQNSDYEAQIHINGTDETASVAEIARGLKQASKEQLSSMMSGYQNLLAQAQTGQQVDQGDLVNAITMTNIATAIHDSPNNYGEDGEFEGLFDTSFWQGANAALYTSMAAMADSVPVASSIIQGVYSLMGGKGDASDFFNEQLSKRSDLGAGLYNQDTAIAVGSAIGQAETFGVIAATSVVAGSAINTKLLAGSKAGVLGKIGASAFGNTIVGSATIDFFLNDIPINLVLAASDFGEEFARTGDVGRAIDYAWSRPSTDPNSPNGLALGFWGPDVGEGFVGNLAQDSFVNGVLMAVPVLQIGGNAFSRKLDALTGGSLSRFREAAAIANLRIQNAVSEVPVVDKVLNAVKATVTDPRDSIAMHEARRASVIAGSTTPYVDMQNAITLRNHRGMDVLAPTVKRLNTEYGIDASVNEFVKNARRYGGIGETKIEMPNVPQSKARISDVLPRQVKQGVNDISVLADGKRILSESGGNSDLRAAVAELQSRVDALPEEIKEFANRFSQYSQAIGRYAAELGVYDSDWIRYIQSDPGRMDYIPRYVLFPKRAEINPRSNPAHSGTLVGELGEFFPDRPYIDPINAIGMKIDAIGRAYADNEVRKALIHTQQILGRVEDGTGVELGEQLNKVKTQLSANRANREALDYDSHLIKFTTGASALEKTFADTSRAVTNPDNINVRATYDPDLDVSIAEFQTEFRNGNIAISDEVKSAANLNDAEASEIVDNIGIIKRTKGGAFSGEGATEAGVPYRFVGEKGTVTSFEKITDPEGMAQALHNSGRYYSTDAVTAAELGEEGIAGAMRASFYFNRNFPATTQRSTLRMFTDKPAVKKGKYTLGYVTTVPKELRVQDGLLTSNPTSIYLSRGGNGTEKYSSRDSGAVKNSDPLTRVIIHENSHLMSQRIAMDRINERVSKGLLDLESLDDMEIKVLFYKEDEKVVKEIIKEAQQQVGGHQTRHALNELRKEISPSASYGSTALMRDRETIAEALVDYDANGENSARLSRAIHSVISEKMSGYNFTTDPKAVMARNGIDGPARMFRNDGSFNFPAKANSREARMRWLDGYRQKNPYLKGEITEENYIKANKWDSFMSHEIGIYGAQASTDFRSTAPDLLLERNAKFIDASRQRIADKLAEQIRKTDMLGVGDEVATMVCSRRSQDISNALESLVVKRVNQMADDIAKSMAEPDLNTARAIVWNDNEVKESASKMVAAFSPTTGEYDARSVVDNIFKKNADGFASFETLPIETKNLMREKDRILADISINNDTIAGYGDPPQGSVISFFEDGQEIYVYINDPIVKQALERPEYKTNGVVADSLTAIAALNSRLYRLTTTSANPISLVRNVLRDPVQAYYSAGYNPLVAGINPLTYYRTLTQMGLSKEVADNVIERIANASRAGTYVSAGRRIEYGEGGVRQITRRVNETLNNSRIINVLEKPMDVWDYMLRQDVGLQSFERHYRRTKDANVALSRALFDTANATTNFSNALGSFRNAAATVPYFSSIINGSRSFLQLYNVDPIGVFTRVTAGLMVPVMALTAYNLSTEENREAYTSLPEWYKSGHLVMTLPGGKMFAAPVPEEVSNFMNISRWTIEYTHESSPYELQSLIAKGAFGFLPVDTDGYFSENGSIDWGRGAAQLAAGVMPQAANAIYEWFAQQDLYTGQDLSDYNLINRILNLATNIFGTGVKQTVNSVGSMLGAGEDFFIGKSFSEQLAQDLFGIGFDNATAQFMEMIGSASSTDPQTGRQTKATGLFAEQEKVEQQVEAIEKQIAYASDERKEALEAQKEKIISDFTNKVASLTNKYMQLYSFGGLEEWQKNKIISVLNLGGVLDAATEGSYQSLANSEAGLNNYSLALQRYVDAGLPAGPSLSSLAVDEDGGVKGSIALRAALNRFYGAPRQAAADFQTALENSNLADIRSEFYDTISAIYDTAEKNKVDPDYDLIERIQARYLQAVDAILVPIINEYGLSILNNNDFVDEVRRYVNGMIPSNDWRRSSTNAKRYLSSKQFPLAAVDVKEWLTTRYASEMKDRGLDSDQVVIDRLQEIKSDIDSGKDGAALGKINSLLQGMRSADFYISQDDLRTLYEYKNMVN